MVEITEEMLRNHKLEILESRLLDRKRQLERNTEGYIKPIQDEIKKLEDEINELSPPKLPDGYEMFEGKVMKVLNGNREGWWRFHDHYDRQGYCDNPARGY